MAARSSSEARIKSYIILQGLERSLAENIVKSCDLSAEDFLTHDERDKAFKRYLEASETPSITIDQLDNEDLLPYLDLGDLIGLLNRNIGSLKNVIPGHVKDATEVVNKTKALVIRKRVMHPIRPLEVDDLTNLMNLASEITRVAPSLIWAPLEINIRRLSKERMFDVVIPSYWAEDAAVIHNLPPAEFDDTGFIGRNKERRELKKLIESDHRVITVVGEGGIGKTALSLRVCNDLLEEEKPIFERIVWVTLKTKSLTTEGVRQINDAIQSLGDLIDRILSVMKIESTASWERIINQLEASNTLLVIDNLETIGEEIRELVINVPSGSKVLLTSRVGLGEIEVRYELSDFAAKDALAFFRSLIAIYNCAPLKNVGPLIIDKYAQKLRFNPLLIKWFVLAVGKGVDPKALISKEGLEEPLSFFYSNIYQNLSCLSKEILSILLAARRELTKVQLQELSKSKSVAFSKAVQELVRTNMIERSMAEDGTMVFQISGLVYSFLSWNFPPDDNSVKRIRGQIKEWQIEKEKSAFKSASYRYGPRNLIIEKADERIAAQHLLRAMKASLVSDFDRANKAIADAEQLTPDWWEVHRVKARIMENQGKPIYEVEEAYETSIRMNDNDVNRYHYTTYLLRQDEFERALEQINQALNHRDAIETTFKSLKGLTLMRMVKIKEAIVELEDVWNSRSPDIPIQVGRTQGTQLAEAYRRQGEKLFSIGERSEATKYCQKAIEIIDGVIKTYKCDRAVVESVVNIITCATGRMEDGNTENYLREKAEEWDKNVEFRKFATEYQKTSQHFQRNKDLKVWFPTIHKEMESLGIFKRYIGEIDFLVYAENYGFINCKDTGRVHISKNSLVNHSMWAELQKGDPVTFGIILPSRRESLPHGINLEKLE